MKIYFGFTVAGNRSPVVAATKIVELLVELGHEVLTRHLIREDAWQADRSISSDIHAGSMETSPLHVHL
jgi:hypothetical protein